MNKFTCCAMLAMLAGCSTTPDYDTRFGDAVRDARTAMTIDPKASANTDPATGIDGQSAREALGRYHDTYKAPPPVVNVINIGGVAGK
ncbi:MAG TPA: hypothetical protein VGD30_17910 [Telluria sp.]